jgi:signal transduction histidine kinase
MTPDKLQLLVDVVQQLSLARDINKITAIVRTAARSLTGADGATFVLRENGLCYYADEDAIAPLWKGQRFDISACVSGWAMINKRPAIIPDIYTDARVPVEAYRPTFVRSVVMVPIRTVDPIGAIGNYWAEPHTATADELQLLQSLADATSIAIENVYVYNELEERVKQRTKQLEAANNELQSFAHSVAHDLRAPLRAANGYMLMLKEDHADKLADSEVQRLMEAAGDRLGDANSLIQALLAFSQMGQRSLSTTTLSMNTILQQVCSDIINTEPNRTIDITLPVLATAEGDPVLIKQVWINLLNNAVKYSATRPVTKIEIGCEEKANEVVYYVRDNGTGFDMRYYDKLFAVLQRLHGEEYKGHGIGLSLVQRILEKHGGKIWAESQPDEGATFWFTLPKAKVAVA